MNLKFNFGAVIPGQGGRLAAIMRGPVRDGIELPPEALIIGEQAVAEFQRIRWGKYGQDVKGATSRTDGRANTAAMLAAECPAALKVRELTIEGHNDYFLAALGELNAAAANVPELFDPEATYWTSTQVSALNAFAQVFEYGYSFWHNKDYVHRVRAFRRVQLDALNA